MSNLAIITARGGSMRIPRKNIRLLYGKPLIAHSIECALGTKGIDRAIDVVKWMDDVCRLFQDIV